MDPNAQPKFIEIIKGSVELRGAQLREIEAENPSFRVPREVGSTTALWLRISAVANMIYIN